MSVFATVEASHLARLRAFASEVTLLATISARTTSVLLATSTHVHVAEAIRNIAVGITVEIICGGTRVIPVSVLSTGVPVVSGLPYEVCQLWVTSDCLRWYGVLAYRPKDLPKLEAC